MTVYRSTIVWGKQAVDAPVVRRRYTLVRPAMLVLSGGAGVTAYTFTQASASAAWTINHNLGRKPAVSIRDTGGREVEAEVVHASVNQALVYFAGAMAGTAYLI